MIGGVCTYGMSYVYVAIKMLRQLIAAQYTYSNAQYDCLVAIVWTGDTLEELTPYMYGIVHDTVFSTLMYIYIPTQLDAAVK